MKTGLTTNAKRFLKSVKRSIGKKLASADKASGLELNEALQRIREIELRARTERISLGKLTQEIDAATKQDETKRAKKSGRSRLEWTNQNLPDQQAGSPGLGKRR
ncbi:MAG: hypothetical protein QGI08_07805 [Paracoccaceae bacterium]|jgi:hypothetical protein|nr:hypothetical protein [Paracoccaceae bacterium]MDP7185608.1 hypothetical protein [Paracoccaceae bacterium]